MVSITLQNYHGLNYQKGKFNGNHKKIDGLGENQQFKENDRVFVIKDSSLEDKDSIP